MCVVKFKELTVDLSKEECYSGSTKVNLTKTEFNLLAFLINNIDKAFYYYYLAVSNGNNKALDALIRYYLFELDEVPWDNNVLESLVPAAR